MCVGGAVPVSPAKRCLVTYCLPGLPYTCHDMNDQGVGCSGVFIFHMPQMPVTTTTSKERHHHMFLQVEIMELPPIKI